MECGRSKEGGHGLKRGQGLNEQKREGRREGLLREEEGNQGMLKYGMKRVGWRKGRKGKGREGEERRGGEEMKAGKEKLKNAIILNWIICQ